MSNNMGGKWEENGMNGTGTKDNQMLEFTTTETCLHHSEGVKASIFTDV